MFKKVLQSMLVLIALSVIVIPILNSNNAENKFSHSSFEDISGEFDAPYDDFKTVTSAALFAKEKLNVSTVVYERYDLNLANTLNRQIYIMYGQYPKMRNKIKYLGDYIDLEKHIEKLIEETSQSLSKADYQNIKEYYSDYIKLPKTSVAVALKSSEFSDFDGIVFNQDFSSSIKKMNQYLEIAKEDNYCPANCKSLDYVVNHELGHLISYFLQLDQKDNLYAYYTALGTQSITAGVSAYAAENYDEFIAECWAEARQEEPRKIALDIGTMIKAYLSDQ